ncbi:MAG: hypothetical protein DRP64_00650, partial [Verrucomicrobia bacterium]
MTVQKLCSNSDSFVFVLSAVKWLAVLGMIGGWVVPSCWGAPNPVDATPEVVTNLAELNQQVSMDQNHVIAIRLEGTVWWSSKTEGRVILKDDTEVLQLEQDLPCQMPDLGDHLILEGDCTARKTRDVIKLSGVPVVENDGVHDAAID